MANHLEIIFTGILYLLGPNDAGNVKVIVPAIPAATAPHGHIIPSHTAYLKVLASNVKSGSFPPDIVVTRSGVAENIYFLGDIGGDEKRGQDVVSVSSSAKDVPAGLSICKEDPCADSNRLSYTKHIAQRRVVCPECPKLAAAYRTSKDSHVVSATMMLDRGYLAAGKPANKGDAWPEWEFRPAGHGGNEHHTAPKMTLSERVSVDMKSDGTFSFTLQGDETRAIHLTAGNVTVEIGNTPAEDLILPPHHRETVDHHFAMFYQMLDAPRPVHPPVPHRVIPDPKKKLTIRDNCPPFADDDL